MGCPLLAFTGICTHVHVLKAMKNKSLKSKARCRRDGSEGRSVGYCSGRSGLVPRIHRAAHKHLAPAPGDLIPSGLQGAPGTHTMRLHSCRQNTSTHTIVVVAAVKY